MTQLFIGAAEAREPTNRQSCSEIAGTRYKSSVERKWYEAHCLKPATTPPTNTTTTWNALMQQFADGYRKGGGPEYWLQHILYRVMPCESTYNPFAVNYGGPYYGLMQFYPSTWYAVGGGDWFSPWWQGYNTARLLRYANPATQWPHCWFA